MGCVNYKKTEKDSSFVGVFKVIISLRIKDSAPKLYTKVRKSAFVVLRCRKNSESMYVQGYDKKKMLILKVSWKTSVLRYQDKMFKCLELVLRKSLFCVSCVRISDK